MLGKHPDKIKNRLLYDRRFNAYTREIKDSDINDPYSRHLERHV